jgi:hypothetical protein
MGFCMHLQIFLVASGWFMAVIDPYHRAIPFNFMGILLSMGQIIDRHKNSLDEPG